MTRLHGAALLLLSFAAGCCTTLSTAPSAPVPGEPAVVLRARMLGYIIGTPPSTRPREHESWEIRIWPDGTVQEARGWNGTDGVLPATNIGAAAARQIIDETRHLANLPEFLGDYVTDTSFHEIEIASATGRHRIAAFPTKERNAQTEQFERLWRSIARRFPEPTVCRGCKEWSCREQP